MSSSSSSGPNNSQSTQQFLEFARRGNLNAVYEAIDQRASVVFDTDALGYTALHWAASAGHAEVVKHLILEKADINARAKNGDTPLHLAVAKEHAKVVALLVQHEADTTVINDAKQTPEQLAMSDEVRAALQGITQQNVASLVQLVQEDDDDDDDNDE